MGDSVTPEVEVLSDMIRQYFSQERSEKETIQALNHLRRVLHEVSPFAQEPVDCVLWVKADEVVANDYNPNVMAPGEKKRKRLVRTVLIFTESSDQLSRATDRVPGLPASPGYVQ